MAQRKQLTWTELRVGLFVLVALFVVAVTIFYVTGGRILGPKYRLITYLPNVEGLKTGAPVALDGLEIGNVQDISLAPEVPERMHNIKLVLRLDRRYQNQIRTDSQAKLVTEGLLGNRYVMISRGITGTPLPPNGVIPGAEEAAMKEVVERGADVLENVNGLTNDMREVIADMKKGKGTIGKLMVDASLYNRLNNTADNLDDVVSSIQEGRGTMGKLVTSEDLYKRADAVMGHMENAMAAVRDQKGTLGRLIYDAAFYDNIKGVAEKGNAFLGDVRDGKGTLGKLATDDALYSNVRDAMGNVRDATAKMNSTQGTMGKFFTDPAFYDNMTGLSGDMRLLIGDFRQNPKKFLHIKLGIF